MKKPHLRRGAAAVEFALVAIVLFSVVFVFFEYGRYVMTRDMVENAAREGARRAVVSTNLLKDDEIKNTVTGYLSTQPVTNLSISVYKMDPATEANLGAWQKAAFGEAITVDVKADYNSIFPTFGLMPALVKLRAICMMRSEAP